MTRTGEKQRENGVRILGITWEPHRTAGGTAQTTLLVAVAFALQLAGSWAQERGHSRSVVSIRGQNTKEATK